VSCPGRAQLDVRIGGIIRFGGVLKKSAVVLLTSLLLTGCSQGSTEPSVDTVEPTKSSAASASPSAVSRPTVSSSPKPTSYLDTVKDPYRGLDPDVGETFLDLAVEKEPDLGYRDIGTMVDMALDICAIYGRGGTGEEVLERIRPKPGTSFNIVEGLTIEAVGVVTFCPEYTAQSQS
jgi:hypothetical protein